MILILLCLCLGESDMPVYLLCPHLMEACNPRARHGQGSIATDLFFVFWTVSITFRDVSLSLFGQEESPTET